MGCFPQNKKRNENVILIAEAVMLVILIFCIFSSGRDVLCDEVFVRDAASELLISGKTEGRQSLVSSVWWAPLPTMLVFAFKFLPFTVKNGVACLIINSFWAAACFILLEIFLRRNRVRRKWRFLIVVVSAFNPYFVSAVTGGSFGVMAAYGMLLVAYSVVAWIKSFRLRHLIYAGLGVACLFIVKFEIGLWAFLCMVIMCASFVFPVFRPYQKQAAIIILCIPFLYVVCLWILLNWLIMGDPLYFINTIKLIEDLKTPQDSGGWQKIILYALPFFVLLFIGWAKKERHNFCLGIMGLAGYLESICLESYGLGFLLPDIYPAIVIVSALSWGCVVSSLQLKGRERISGLVVLLFTLISWNSSHGFVNNRIVINKYDFLREEIRTYVTKENKYVKVFLSGYKGLIFAPPLRSGKELSLIHI